jgi:alanine racemase
MQIKHLKAGESAGYDETFTAKKDMIIGILPIGYNDGLDRRFSNK